MKWFLVAIAIIIAGIVALNLIGGFLITEITQEVRLEAGVGTPSNARIGKYAPDWKLPDLSGKEIKLVDFLGTPLVLTFWTTWNPAAADQIKIFDDYIRSNAGGLFEITTVSSQERKSVVENFMRRGGYETEVLLDESGAVGESYGARHLPATYFIDKEGIVRDVFVGVLSEKMLAGRVEKIVR